MIASLLTVPDLSFRAMRTDEGWHVCARMGATGRWLVFSALDWLAAERELWRLVEDANEAPL